ncbi:MAG TPA: glutamine amidotransferase [Vicinamibacterales bacterium]|nr:glutamine amidotransferase [Vicinamibacterales bacterium]
MARIYYAGDWAVLVGPSFAETPFYHSPKGLEIFNYGTWLTDALQSTGEHQVTSVPAWDFYKLPPGGYERVLEGHDVFVFSDVDAKLFQLAPSFFDREKFGSTILTFPDRIRLTIDAVRAGKGVMFLGGWYSFTGEMGKGGWGRTRLAELLPVRCLETEDLVESTEGFTARPTAAGAPAFAGLDLGAMPPLLGYNKVRPSEDGRVLAEVRETGDPLVAVRRCGAGRSLAFMSDPAPHWACNFVFWERYAEFWLRCLGQVLPDSGR